jgi:hypothetical protein
MYGFSPGVAVVLGLPAVCCVGVTEFPALAGCPAVVEFPLPVAAFCAGC